MRNLQGGKGPSRTAPPSIREQTLQFLELAASPPEPADPFSLVADYLRYQRSVRKSLDPVYGPLDRLLARAREDPSVFVPQFLRLKTNTLYGSWRAATELMQKEMDWKMPPGQKGLLHTSCRIEKVKDYCQSMADRQQFQRSGWFLDLGAEYTGWDLLTPQLFAWWSTGEDASWRNGSERMPIIRPSWGPGNSFLFDDSQAFGRNSNMPSVDGDEGETLAQRARREVAVRCDMALSGRGNSRKRRALT